MEPRSRRNAVEDMIRLDSEGNWYQGDFPILHERTCQFFYKHIALDADGKYYLEGEERPVYIKVEDVPYWITKVERTIAGYLVSLTDESIELLDLNSLWIGKKNALYCAVKGGSFPAKFMRVPYYEITKDLQQRGKKYFLVFRGKSYSINTSPPKNLTPSGGGGLPRGGLPVRKSGGKTKKQTSKKGRHVRGLKKAAKKKKR
ncbi:MAG: DUF1285 domain-containing protein [Deltaproteobacteria bacterium]|nr:DUF1285 domain-containing protein [Deltaproteobacteria bacterium]